MAETVFWLIRHPETAARGICYGSLDVPLSETGVRQGHALAGALAAEPFDAIYTSPLQRCAEAARILAQSRPCPPVPMAALRELNFGAFEGGSYDELAACHPELYRQWMDAPTEVEFPGGESFAAMRSRVLAAAGELRARHAGRRIALVTHGGVIRILLADALGLDLPNIFRIAQDYCALNIIRYLGESSVVALMNGRPLPHGRGSVCGVPPCP